MSYASAPLFHITGPLIMPPPQGTVRSGQFLKGFKPLVKSLGGNWLRILEDNQVNAALIDAPERAIGWRQATSLLEYCSRTLKDDLFGIRLAMLQGAGVYGSVAVLAQSAPTLRQAIQCIIDFVPFMHSPGAQVELVASQTTAEIRWYPGTDLSCHDQASYHGLMLAVRLLAGLGGDTVQPAYAVTISEQKHNRDAIERSLGCKVHWGGSNEGIGFSAALLDQPLGSSNPILFGLLSSYLWQLKEAHGPGLSQQVQYYIDRALRSGDCSIIGCAGRLGLSPRTLQKRLTAQGLSFSGMVEEQRVAAAKGILLNTSWTLNEVAAHLGYSEKSSFSRAFKKSTRLTPMAFRAKGGAPKTA